MYSNLKHSSITLTMHCKTVDNHKNTYWKRSWLSNRKHHAYNIKTMHINDIKVQG